MLQNRLFAFLLLLVGVLGLLFATVVQASSSSGATTGTSSSRTTMETTTRTTTTSETESDKRPPLVVRFYFIRHGQTTANIDNIVVGQRDWPLTEQGIHQAKLLSQSDLIQKSAFWRLYVSDLGRAQQTASLILGVDDKDQLVQSLGVRLDQRLRELSKGAREGYPKKTTYQEAVIRFRQEHGDSQALPLLETEVEGWHRVYGWLYEVVRDAVQEYRQTCLAQTDGGDAQDDEDQSRSLSIFALSHSGLLRVLLNQLVGEQLPASVDRTPVGADGSQEGMLKIPNTSVTIIDIVPRKINDELWDVERQSAAPPNDHSLLWTAQLVELTWTGHYNKDKQQQQQ